jgi:hypothetical protein
MPVKTITLKFVNPPKDNFKASIVGIDGARYTCKPEHIPLFRVGGTYTIETKEGTYNGKPYQTVLSATAVEATAPQRPSSTAATSAPVPCTPGTGGELRDEQIFVCALLKEAIRANLVPIDKDSLTSAIKHIRAGYRAGFGSNTFTASEAGHFTSDTPRIARG